jgi:hypothetical protein
MMFIIKKIYNKILTYYFKKYDNNLVYVLINKKEFSNDIQIELTERLHFYLEVTKTKIKFIKSNNYTLINFIFFKKVKLFYGFKIKNRYKNFLEKSLFFDIDFNKNHEDGWNWHKALNKISFSDVEFSDELIKSKIRFLSFFDALEKKDKAYILGTGPSLANAINLGWNDGYKIVCNTIVKDKKLWKHIDPEFIVAGDAIYHFGDNGYAKSFISDLKERLSESKTFFIYPSLFHGFLVRELFHFKERLVPIPINYNELNVNGLFKDFYLPFNTGNVLNSLLLPMATTISKKVYLYGFDGRAPSDKLFWSNSKNHSYSDKLHEIIEKHPEFFKFHVPQGNEKSYVENVHGKKLDDILLFYEKNGYDFVMMHQTWTDTLAKRKKYI